MKYLIDIISSLTIIFIDKYCTFTPLYKSKLPAAVHIKMATGNAKAVQVDKCHGLFRVSS